MNKRLGDLTVTEMISICLEKRLCPGCQLHDFCCRLDDNPLYNIMEIESMEIIIEK